MKIYVQKAELVNGHIVRVYCASKKKCASIRAKLRKDGVMYGKTRMPINKIYEPEKGELTKSSFGIIEFLNYQTPTLNGFVHKII